MQLISSKLPRNISVPFLGQDLLPVTLDSNLTFNGHIASLTSFLLWTSVQINRVWHLFCKDVLYIILNSLVFSKLFYCSTVSSGTSKENVNTLQLMQNFAGRVLTNTKTFDHITPVLHKLGWLTIEALLCLRENDLVPSYSSTNFVKRSETHSYCTRLNNQLILPQRRTSAAQRAFRFRASKNIGTIFPMILQTLPLLRFLKGVPGSK